jgi:hypothetical protein
MDAFQRQGQGTPIAVERLIRPQPRGGSSASNAALVRDPARGRPVVPDGIASES